jgi:hypothetical protein
MEMTQYRTDCTHCESPLQTARNGQKREREMEERDGGETERDECQNLEEVKCLFFSSRLR